jgi:hypothetical protein
MAFMAAWTCAKLGDGRSGMGHSSSSRLLKNTDRLFVLAGFRSGRRECMALVDPSPRKRYGYIMEAAREGSLQRPL